MVWPVVSLFSHQKTPFASAGRLLWLVYSGFISFHTNWSRTGGKVKYLHSHNFTTYGVDGWVINILSVTLSRVIFDKNHLFYPKRSYFPKNPPKSNHRQNICVSSAKFYGWMCAHVRAQFHNSGLLLISRPIASFIVFWRLASLWPDLFPRVPVFKQSCANTLFLHYNPSSYERATFGMTPICFF